MEPSDVDWYAVPLFSLALEKQIGKSTGGYYHPA
jgi:hypothetical protein